MNVKKFKSMSSGSTSVCIDIGSFLGSTTVGQLTLDIKVILLLSVGKYLLYLVDTTLQFNSKLTVKCLKLWHFKFAYFAETFLKRLGKCCNILSIYILCTYYA